MSLTTRIEQDYIAAYKAKDALRLGVLRLLKTAAKNLQVELMRPVTDEELASVVQKQAKQRQDSIEQFTAANRPDLAEKEAAELSILKDYLPEPLSEEELAAEEKRRQKRIRDHEKYLRQKERKQKIAEGLIVPGEPYQLVCQCCGEPFQSVRPNAKFCKPACREKFYRQEKRKAKETETSQTA